LRVVTVFLDTPALRQALTALRSSEKEGIRVRRHPWEGQPRMLMIQARSYDGGRAVAALVELHATCTWGARGWSIHRVQLPLFRSAA
jgi:hypothetical protein